ncbi:unnamed protein product [Prorocentrum cordatum]|uniref:RING-type E3 ubiquitin transferase n=1 Tax=Prorocentrum cordatum TaxID=2364126 RepID=A0ABN9SIA5_9DINO|nr:unnamed protein product [Polarella glacialis]
MFREGPLRSAQTPRSPEEHASEQPLFCQEASCAAACGPPQAALALAAGRLRRAELLEFVRHNEGDGAALARWLDFASKTPALPVLGGEAAPGIFAAPGADEPGGSGCAGALACFCSAGCRDQWLRGGHLAAAASRGCVAARALLRRAEEAGGPDPTLRRNLTVMTAEALLEAARPWLADLRAGRLGRAHRGVLGALAPILGAAAGASPLRRGALPTRALASAHSLLLDAVVEVASGAGGWQLQASGRRLRRQWAGLVLPRGLFEGVLAVLDKCAWSLDGSTLPSPLARYCGALRGGGGDGAAEAEAVAAIGPVVRALCEQQDALAEDSEEEGEEAGSAGEAAAAEAPPGAIPLPPPERARGMRPVLVPHLLGAEEIALVKQVSQDAAARDHHKHAAGSQWRTRYLRAGRSGTWPRRSSRSCGGRRWRPPSGPAAGACCGAWTRPG